MKNIFALLVFLITGLPALAASPFATGTAQVCEKTYALCTSAPCIPDPMDPEGRAICECEVARGANYGTSRCEDRPPFNITKNTTRVLSTYSFVQAPTKPVIACDAQYTWTDCLDQPCIVDPKNPLRAICSCEIVSGEAFLTYGGSCNVNTCETAFWSAATSDDFVAGSQALMDKMGLTETPYRYCPGADPG